MSVGDDWRVGGISVVTKSTMWINGGYFVLRREIFDYINEGEELVEQPFARLIQANKLGTYQHRGFWQTMETV